MIADVVTVNLFRGLIAIGHDGEIEVDLAERFTVSDDGCRYRFAIRADAHWSDGAPVTAGDFTFTFARMVEDDLCLAEWLAGVTAHALDDRTLDLVLDEPRNHFLYLLARQWFFPGRGTSAGSGDRTGRETYRSSATGHSSSPSGTPTRTACRVAWRWIPRRTGTGPAGTSAG